MQTSKRRKARRKTPWDAKRVKRVAIPPEEALPECNEKQDLSRLVSFHLRGRYVFNPDRTTRDEFRQFLWSGLRVLRAEARAKGLSDTQVCKLLVHAFDSFHDVEDSLWVTLKKVVSEKKTGRNFERMPPSFDDTCIACEEDRPILIELESRDPMTFIDPDATLLQSWESCS